MKTITESQFKELLGSLPEFEPKSGLSTKEVIIELDITWYIRIEYGVIYSADTSNYDEPRDAEVIDGFVFVIDVIGYDGDNKEYTTTAEQDAEIIHTIEQQLGL